MSFTLPTAHSAQVTAIKQLSPKIFWVQAQFQQPLTYEPGQYGSLMIKGQRRPLSFATPRNGHLIELIVDVSPNGVASQFIRNLNIGDDMAFMAPYGRFVVETAPVRPQLFIAAGSGIAPIRAQILSLLQTKSQVPITLLFGNRSEEYMFLTEEFQALERQYVNFQFIPILSEPSSSWTGERGLVTEALGLLPSLITSYSIYVCGHPNMVTATRKLLSDALVPKEQVYFEQFTFSQVQ